MNIVQLNNFIEKIVSCTETVKSFYTNSVYECWNAEEVKYGSISFCITKTQMRERTMTYDAIIYYGDRLLEDKSNRNAIWSDATQVIQSIIGTVNSVDGEITISYPYNLTLFEQKFADELAGAYAEISIEVEGIGECGDLLYGYEDGEGIKLESVVKTFTINGEYDIVPSDGFDAISDVKVIVDVPIQSKSVEFNSNGSYNVTPDSGYAAMDNVEVNVNIPLQNKSVEFNSNGSYNVTPDSEYAAMDNVGVNVNIPLQNKSVEFNSNGSYNVTPDSEYAAMDNVGVNVNIPLQSKSVTYSEVGDYQVTPDPGYEALSRVNVKVSLEGIPKIPNGFRFTGGDMSLVEWDKYDWSMVYDTAEFFKGCTFSDPSWVDRFNSGFNGRVMSGYSMFENCSTLENTPDLSSHKLYTMDHMFSGCKKLKSISMMDTSEVVDATYAFTSCYELQSIPQLDFSSVRNAQSMFNGCSKLTTITGLEFQSLRNVTSMFRGCNSLTTIPPLNTSNVNDMSYMFENCKSLTTIPQLDSSNVTDMTNMFSGCTKLINVPQLDISSMTNMFQMFLNCRSLKEIRFKGKPQTSMDYAYAFSKIAENGTLYYDSRYDYSIIINILPSTWTAVPYDVD